MAAARSRNGASYQLVSMLPSRDYEIALTVALYTEWQAVLTRQEHWPPGVTIDAALAFLRFKRAPELKVRAITPADFLRFLRS